MFAVHKQTHPPTTVEACLSTNFVSAEESNLIIAKNTLLEVYRLKSRPPRKVRTRVGLSQWDSNRFLSMRMLIVAHDIRRVIQL